MTITAVIARLYDFLRIFSAFRPRIFFFLIATKLLILFYTCLPARNFQTDYFIFQMSFLFIRITWGQYVNEYLKHEDAKIVEI